MMCNVDAVNEGTQTCELNKIKHELLNNWIHVEHKH